MDTAGKYGQLGHGDTSKRTTGRAVKHLYGCEVVDIACGLDFVMTLTSWKATTRHRSIKNQPHPLQRDSTIRSLPTTSCDQEILVGLIILLPV